jgi:hypothetical protein
MRSLSIGSTGMYAQQMNVDTISNNIANMTTAGFKRQRPEFQDLLYQNIRRPGISSTDNNTILPAGFQLAPVFALMLYLAFTRKAQWISPTMNWISPSTVKVSFKSRCRTEQSAIRVTAASR